MKSIKKKAVGKKKFNFVWIIIAILAMVAIAFFGINAITGNFILDDVDYALSGYSKPIDVFNENATIFSVSPDLDIVSSVKTFTVTVNHSDAYIYRRGFYWNQTGGNWVNFTFPQNTIGNSNWIADFASTDVVVSVSEDFSAGENLFITYSCQKIGSDWKCGCNSVDDEVCNRWMLQIVNVSGVVEPSCVDESECVSGFTCVVGKCVEKVVGIGTPEDPFRIYNCSELQNMSNNLTASYELASNIDCSATSGWNDNAGFEPIGNNSGKFIGNFNGNGHKIIGLYISYDKNNLGYPQSDFKALFGIVEGSAIIKNVSLLDVNISGRYQIGGLVGSIFSSDVSISHIYVSGEVNGDYNVGGVVGFSEGNVSFSRADISSTWLGLSGNNGALGGLVGAEYYSTVSDSYAFIDMKGFGGNSIGTLVGYTYGDGNVKNSYGIGDINRLVNGAQSNSFSCNLSICTDGNARAYYTNSNNAPMNSWDFENVWAIDSSLNNGYPYLKWAGASVSNEVLDNVVIYDYGIYDYSLYDYGITNCTDLQNMKNDLNGKYILMNDIDCSMTRDWSAVVGYQTVTGFEPIDGAFAGSLEGAGHKISDLYIDRRSSANGAALFANINGAISNVHLVNVYMRGWDRSGCLAGQSGAIISNCSCEGIVIGNGWSGGLVGYQYANSISNSYFIGDVSGGYGVGGLVGTLNTAAISNSYVVGKVTGNGYGVLLGFNERDGIVSNSFWDSQIYGQTVSAGGTGKTTSEMNAQSTFTAAGWDFANVWTIDSNTNGGYPTLRW